MRVLHVLPWVGHGGVERRRLQLARGLGPQFEQHLVCLSGRPPLTDDLDEAGCAVHQLRPWNDRSLNAHALYAVAKVAREVQPDIVHGAVFEGVTLAVVAAKASRARLVIEETSCPTDRSWRGDALFWMWSQIADHVVAVSPAVSSYLESRGVYRPKRVEILNGIDRPTTPTEDELAALRTSLGLDGMFVVGSIGRLWDDFKRFTLLVDAFHRLHQRRPNTRLVIVGDGPDRAKIQAAVDACGLQAAVTLTGYRQDVGTMLGVMDVFALSSKTESFALVVAEAMMSKVPVIATSVGGVPGVVGDAGILVPAENSQALADALLNLMDAPPEHRRSMAESGEARASRLFSSERYVADVRALYRNLA